MELIHFISESSEHFIGFLLVLTLCFLGSSMLVLAIGYAIARARGYVTDDECSCNRENDVHEMPSLRS